MVLSYGLTIILITWIRRRTFSIYGLTTVFGMRCNPDCLNKIGYCNGVSVGCANSSAIYYVTVNLDTNEITNLANGLSSAGFSTSSSELALISLRTGPRS